MKKYTLINIWIEKIFEQKKISFVKCWTMMEGGEPRSVNPWPYIVRYFEYVRDVGTVGVSFRCLECQNVYSASRKSMCNLKKHVLIKHPQLMADFEACIRSRDRKRQSRNASERFFDPPRYSFSSGGGESSYQNLQTVVYEDVDSILGMPPRPSCSVSLTR